MNDYRWLVICRECGHEQADMGAHVDCDECGAGPMPYHDDFGNLIED